MTRARSAALAALLAALLASLPAAPAAAQDASEDEINLDEAMAKRFSHRGQVILQLATGTGYRAIFPYDGEFCGELKDDGGNQAHCLARSPFGLDLALGFGLTDRLEGFVELRLGVERDVGQSASAQGPRAASLAPGIKYYLADLGSTMFFSTLQLVVDFTGFEQVDKNDIGVRNINGLQLDLHHTFGLFFYFGEQASWRRWLRFEVEAGLGAQVRFP